MMQETALTERPAVSWTDFVSLRWKRIDRPQSNLGKVALEAFMRAQDIPHLEVLRLFSQAADVTFAELPPYFVFKPASLWSGTGVRLLHKIAGLDSYFDAKNNAVLTEAQIKQSAVGVEKKFGRKLEFIVEQRALDEDAKNKVPLDYKVFTFYGVSKFILQVDRNFNPPKMAFFDGAFEPITDGRAQLNSEDANAIGTHRRPKCWQGILDVARQTTIKLKAPFISVDCYATPEGPILGELTHTPGGPWYGNMYAFSAEFDRELGTAWREANDRLGLPEVSVKVPFQIARNNKVFRTIY